MASPFDMNNTFGALYIGAVAGAILFGLGTVQVFIYFQNHKGSGLTFYKLAVCWLWLFDALHVYAINHTIYHYLITNYGNPLALAQMVWSVKVLLITDALIVYSVHVLYLQRIWILSKWGTKIVPTAMTVIIVSAFAVTIVLSWAILKCRFLSDLSRIQWSIYLSLGTASVIDCLIASSLCYLFHTAKTGFTKTDMTLRTLMRDVITTGCLTSICSLTCIITKVSMPDNFIFLGIELLLSTLYVNSYLALLNARYYQGSDRGNTSQPQSSYVYRPGRQVNVSHEISSRISKPDEFQVCDVSRWNVHFPWKSS